MRILLDDPPAEGGGGALRNALPPSSAPPPAIPRANPTPAPPPAGTIVTEGTRTEREVQLQGELDAEREAKKAVEMKNGQLEDQIHKMTETQTEKAWRYRPFKT